MVIRRVLTSVVGLGLIAVLAAGCGGNTTPSSPSTPEPVAPNINMGTPEAVPTPGATGGASAAPAPGGWGDLQIQFVYAGTPPTPAKLNVDKDVEFCGKHNLVDESLLVDGTSKGIANIIVWLYDKPPDIHTSYGATANATVRMDNMGCRFEPHVCVLRTTQTLELHNSDTPGHNTKGDVQSNTAFNHLIPGGGSINVTLNAPERLPAPVGCNIHPWMNGWLVVQEHPYVGVSDVNGKLVIKNLPTGKWNFVAWHEKSGYTQDVTVGGTATSWSKGRFEWTINEGENNVGTVELKPAVFEK
jgi:hypothetical protein